VYCADLTPHPQWDYYPFPILDKHLPSVNTLRGPPAVLSEKVCIPPDSNFSVVPTSFLTKFLFAFFLKTSCLFLLKCYPPTPSSHTHTPGSNCLSSKNRIPAQGTVNQSGFGNVEQMQSCQKVQLDIMTFLI